MESQLKEVRVGVGVGVGASDVQGQDRGRSGGRGRDRGRAGSGNVKRLVLHVGTSAGTLTSDGSLPAPSCPVTRLITQVLYILRTIASCWR